MNHVHLGNYNDTGIWLGRKIYQELNNLFREK